MLSIIKGGVDREAVCQIDHQIALQFVLSSDRLHFEGPAVDAMHWLNQSVALSQIPPTRTSSDEESTLMATSSIVKSFKVPIVLAKPRPGLALGYRASRSAPPLSRPSPHHFFRLFQGSKTHYSIIVCLIPSNEHGQRSHVATIRAHHQPSISINESNLTREMPLCLVAGNALQATASATDEI
jgi:hypothetical protein